MRWVWLSLISGLLLPGLGVTQVSAPAFPPSLTVEEIVTRMTDRVGDDRQRVAGLRHSWRRITIIEDFDSRGRIEETRTKEHRVVARNGDQQSSLIKLNGQVPAPRDRAREGKRESENRDKYTQRSDRRKDRRGNIEIDPKLIRRFRFQWLSNDVINGRWTCVLAFAPPRDSGGGKVADLILANLGGRVWVDGEVFEIARIEAQLLRPVNIGGFIAEVSELQFQVDRRPLPGGPWVNIKLESRAAGRKLFDRFSGRMEVRQEDFEPLPDNADNVAASH